MPAPDGWPPGRAGSPRRGGPGRPPRVRSARPPWGGRARWASGNPTRRRVGALMFASRHTAASLALAACLFTTTRADDKADDRAKVTEVKKIALARLSNEELLKQAGAFHARASGEYLAALRSLAGSETQLDGTGG